MFFAKTVKAVAERLPFVANLYRRLRDQFDYFDQPVESPWGFKLAGNANMSSGSFEVEETTFVRSVLKEVDLFVNVGANVGYYCCHALSMEKPIIAFEPIQRNVNYLLKNMKANGWSCAEVYPVALSNLSLIHI